MSNQLTADGLQVKTYAQILADFTSKMQAIYGADINVDSNSPDGQMLNIFAQAAVDNLELLVDVYNSFSIESAYGVALDQRVALNGIFRKAGTHTITDVNITTSTAVNLIGVDALIADPETSVYTVSDNDGVEYQLLESVTTITGVNSLSFQSKEIGVIEPIPNTITNQITVIANVTAVNNPVAALSVGTEEETDVDLKIRHAKSFYLASTGPADSIEAALLSIPDVIDAFVAENDTDSPVDDVSARSIWCIVNGGTDAEVGNAIYSKKMPGCGMDGDESYVVTRPNGSSFTAKFDRALTEDLYIKFTVSSRIPNVEFNADYLAEKLVENLTYKLNQSPSIGDVIISMYAIEPRAVLSVVGVSIDGMSYTDIVTPSDFQHYFTLDVANIDITLL